MINDRIIPLITGSQNTKGGDDENEGQGKSESKNEKVRVSMSKQFSVCLLRIDSGLIRWEGSTEYEISPRISNMGCFLLYLLQRGPFSKYHHNTYSFSTEWSRVVQSSHDHQHHDALTLGRFVFGQE